MSAYRIEICDSQKRKGEFFVRYIGGTNKLASTETETTFANINKNIRGMASIFVDSLTIEYIMQNCSVTDKTKAGKWAKKFGIEHKPSRK